MDKSNKIIFEDYDEKKEVPTTEYPAIGKNNCQSSSFPVSDSVHSVGGLDIDEMDCFRRQFRLYCPLWSLLSGTSNESSLYW